MLRKLSINNYNQSELGEDLDISKFQNNEYHNASILIDNNSFRKLKSSSTIAEYQKRVNSQK